MSFRGVEILNIELSGSWCVCVWNKDDFGKKWNLCIFQNFCKQFGWENETVLTHYFFLPAFFSFLVFSIACKKEKFDFQLFFSSFRIFSFDGFSTMTWRSLVSWPARCNFWWRNSSICKFVHWSLFGFSFLIYLFFTTPNLIPSKF